MAKRITPHLSSDRGGNHLCSQIPTSKVKILLCFSFPALFFSKSKNGLIIISRTKGEKCILTKLNKSSIKDPLYKFQGSQKQQSSLLPSYTSTKMKPPLSHILLLYLASWLQCSIYNGQSTNLVFPKIFSELF